MIQIYLIFLKSFCELNYLKKYVKYLVCFHKTEIRLTREKQHKNIDFNYPIFF